MLALITLVGLITITLSTYLITYSHLLYERLTPGLSWFERKIPFREAAMETMADWSRSFDMIVFGLGRFGNHITREFSEHGRQVLGVDFDPDVVRRLGDCDCTIVYGDAEDPEFAATLPLSRADWVVSSVPQLSVNLTLLQSLARHGSVGRTATTAHNAHSAEELRSAGSDVVFLPFQDAAKEAVDRVCAFSSAELASKIRKPVSSDEEQSL